MTLLKRLSVLSLVSVTSSPNFLASSIVSLTPACESRLPPPGFPEDVAEFLGLWPLSDFLGILGKLGSELYTVA